MSLPADRLVRPAWSCVHFVREGPDPDRLAELGIAVVGLDAAQAAGEEELVRALARAFRFPEYFGGNWDAVDEVLRDLSWMPAAGYVLVVRRAEGLWRREPRFAGRLVRAWLFCAERWAERGTPFHLVFEW